VTWRVGDDELTPGRGEIAVSDVDGDLLFTLGLQAVDQERKIERPSPRGSGSPGIMLDGVYLILVDQ